MANKKKRFSMWWVAVLSLVSVVVGSQLSSVGTGHVNDQGLFKLLLVTSGLVLFLAGISGLVTSIVIGIKRLISRAGAGA